jgi:putative pyruvate formate lyase activating enzyme
MMLSLQRRGCHNINLVTPTHVVPQILEALGLAITEGLHVPLVYNCGGYESVETLRLLDGIVDIYMPDMKYSDSSAARQYSDVDNYAEINRAAVKEMHRQVGDLEIDDHGVAIRGLLVRHLVLPHGMAGTHKTVEFLASEVSSNTYLNVMAQYHPCHRAHDFPGLSRAVTREEYLEAVTLALQHGLTRLDQLHYPRTARVSL